MLIEVKEIAPPADWYAPASYPGDGVYLHSNTVFFVYGDNVTFCMTDIPPSAVAEEKSSGVSESLFLRSIAVAQRPELAKDLS